MTQEEWSAIVESVRGAARAVKKDHAENPGATRRLAGLLYYVAEEAEKVKRAENKPPPADFPL